MFSNLPNVLELLAALIHRNRGSMPYTF